MTECESESIEEQLPPEERRKRQRRKENALSTCSLKTWWSKYVRKIVGGLVGVSTGVRICIGCASLRLYAFESDDMFVTKINTKTSRVITGKSAKMTIGAILAMFSNFDISAHDSTLKWLMKAMAFQLFACQN